MAENCLRYCAPVAEGARRKIANGNGERNHKQNGDTVLKATGDKPGDGQNHGVDYVALRTPAITHPQRQANHQIAHNAEADRFSKCMMHFALGAV